MKNLKKIIGILFCFLFGLIFFVGCSNSLEENVSQCVSEYRQNFFFGQGKFFSASFTDGKREKEYIANGVKTDLTDFGVVVVRVNSGDIGKKYLLKINDESYEGELEVNPFDMTLVVDIQRRVNENDKIFLTINGEEVELKNLSSSWEIDCNKALNIFVEHNREKLNEYSKKDKFVGEIFIKIVADKNDISNIYYFVLCVNQDGNVIANLISVKTGEIVQKA